MQTVTAKEAKNRLGQVVDLALAEKAVAISKNGREVVALVSAEYFRELSGVQGFIQDAYAAEKTRAVQSSPRQSVRDRRNRPMLPCSRE